MTRSAINHEENRMAAAVDASRRPKKPRKCPLTAEADRAFHAMRKVRGNPWASTWAAAKAHWKPGQPAQAESEALAAAEALFRKGEA